MPPREQGPPSAARVARVRPVSPETFTTCMEQLQEGYVASVAATAGCLFDPVSRDYFGMDAMLIRSGASDEEEISVYVQLKSTTTAKPDPSRDSFSFQFKHRDHMQRLVNPRKGVKAILVVMVTHPEQARWARGDHESLTLLHCCYWVSLEGRTVAPGVQRPTIRIPTANVFTPDALTEILDKLERGEDLGG